MGTLLRSLSALQLERVRKKERRQTGLKKRGEKSREEKQRRMKVWKKKKEIRRIQYKAEKKTDRL